MTIENKMDKLVPFARAEALYSLVRKYTAAANSWDYGPLGVELKNNVKAALVEKVYSGVPLQCRHGCGILMNPQTHGLPPAILEASTIP